MSNFNKLTLVIAVSLLAASCSSDENPPSNDSAAEKIAFADLNGDAQNGEQLFAQCLSCHSVEGGINMTGPSLAGIMGSTAGSAEGFSYSPAHANSGIVWTEENMFAFLENPRNVIPNTKMIFAGIRDPQDRADVLAHMKTIN